MLIVSNRNVRASTSTIRLMKISRLISICAVALSATVPLSALDLPVRNVNGTDYSHPVFKQLPCSDYNLDRFRRLHRSGDTGKGIQHACHSTRPAFLLIIRRRHRKRIFCSNMMWCWIVLTIMPLAGWSVIRAGVPRLRQQQDNTEQAMPKRLRPLLLRMTA